MKVMIDIPKDFEKHFNKDRFKDSLERIKYDVNSLKQDALSWRYDVEIIDMLMVAFKKAEVFHSTCTLEGIPVCEMNCDDIWNEAYDKRDGVKSIRAIDADELTKPFPQIIDNEPTLCVVPTKEIYKLRNRLYKLSNDKWDKWESFERSGCDNKYLLGKAHAYSIVVDMIDDLLKDRLGDDNNA